MVSVIIPTFNREKTIERSVRSVLCQTYQDLEVIVVDDGSEEATESVITEIRAPRVKYYRQENSGACAARNKGISLSAGEYIAFHDSDDVWRAEKLEKQISTAVNTNADIIFCCMQRRNMGDGSMVIPELPESGFLSYDQIMVGISTQTLFMKRKVAEEFRFDEAMPRFQDLEWLLRAAKVFTLYGMKDVLVDYYLSDDSIGRSGRKLYCGIRRIFRKHPGLREENPGVFERLRLFLVEEGLSMMDNNRSGYQAFLKAGFALSDRRIDRLKYLTVKTGCFKTVYGVKQRLKAMRQEYRNRRQ